MNRRFQDLVILYMLIMACATRAEDTCTIRVTIPQRMFGDTTTASLVLSANGENGENDLGECRLTPASENMLSGECSIEVKEPVAASMVWAADPHVGFTFFVEPGTVSAKYIKEGTCEVSGTPLNDAYTSYRKELESTPYDSQDSLTEVYMRKYRDTPLFGMLFTGHSAVTFRGDKEQVERLWAIGGEKGHKMKYAQSAYERICHNDVVNGEKLRDVVIPHATVDGEGQTIRLSDYIGRGKWVFVDFWASWCVGCRQAIPVVKEAYAKLKEENVQFISIAEWDRRAAALKAMKEEQMPWLQLIDEKGACGDAYLFNSIPRFMLFAPDGTLIEKDVGRNSIVSLLTDKITGGK